MKSYFTTQKMHYAKMKFRNALLLNEAREGWDGYALAWLRRWSGWLERRIEARANRFLADGYEKARAYNATHSTYKDHLAFQAYWRKQMAAPIDRKISA